MRQAYDVASRSIQQLLARGKGYYVRKAFAAVLLPGYCVPVGNLSGRESPGKLCSHLEEEIHVIQEHISIGPVYQVSPNMTVGNRGYYNGTYFFLVMFYHCLNKWESRQRPPNCYLEHYPNLKTLERVPKMSRRWKHHILQLPMKYLVQWMKTPHLLPTWPPWPGGLYQYGRW